MDRLELPKSKYQIHRQIESKNLSAFFITLKRRNQICCPLFLCTRKIGAVTATLPPAVSGDQVLFQMLKANSNIDTVCLCMDNDAAGQAANKRISNKLFIQGIKHEILVPEFKDWNEDLLCDEQEETECQTLQL